jgi:hypothetical protein
VENLLPDGEQAFLHVLLPDAAFLDVNQADILPLGLEEVEHRYT